MARLSIARQLSYDALCLVLCEKKDPSLILGEMIASMHSVPKRIDRNLAFEITFGSLRWWSKIYWILQNHSTRDLDECSVPVRVALVAGTYQIYYLDRVPDRACVNESAEYVRMRKQSKAVPFVNGILRQVATRARYFPKPDSEEEPAAFLSLQCAHPPWLVERWLERFGYKRLEGMLKQSNQRPPVTVRLIREKASQFESLQEMQRHLLRTERIRTTKRPLKYCFHVAERPALDKDSLFDQGYFTLQDESSQLIGLLVDPKPGEVIVDACAGPGGKLGHIYDLMASRSQSDLAVDGTAEVKDIEESVEEAAEEAVEENVEENVEDSPPSSQARDDVDGLHKNIFGDGGALIAFEKKPSSYERMIATLARLGCHGVQCFAQDFLSYNPTCPPHKILLDAPCSGLGVLSRHPEGKLFKDHALIVEMAQYQRALLSHGLDILAPGGELIYSVCSFESEETEDHLAWLEETFPRKFCVISPKSRLQNYYRKYVLSNKILLIYCGNADGMDGFGAFILKKASL